MSTSEYLVGMGLLLGLFAPLMLAAVEVRRSLMPRWSGSMARLTEAVLVLTMAVLVPQVLSIVHWFRIWPMLVANFLLASAMVLWSRRHRGSPMQESTAPTERVEVAIGGLAAAIVLGQWAVRVAEVVNTGLPQNVDTYYYHLPFAARYLQDSSVFSVHFVQPDPYVAYLPGNGSVVHALLMLPFDRAWLFPFVNIGFAALTLLAAWCIGKPWGRPGATLTAAAVVLGTPILVFYQPGDATNDTMILFALLAAIAFVVHGDDQPRALALAALIGGFAIGTKLTALAPFVALALTTSWNMVRGRRLRTLATWVAGVAVVSGLGLVRNAARTGNPLPWFHIGIGDIGLPRFDTPVFDLVKRPFVRYLLDVGAWRDYFAPGFALNFGPLWWLVLLASIAALLWEIRALDSRLRILGVTGLFSFAMYSVTPFTAGGPPAPVFFAYTARYCLPAVVVGLTVIAISGRGPAWRRRAPAGFLLALLAMDVAAQIHWSLGPHLGPISASSSVRMSAVVAAAAAVVFGGWLAQRGPTRRMVVTLGAAFAVLAVVAGAQVQRVFLTNVSAQADADPALRALRNEHGQRILVTEYLTQFPLFGSSLDNQVIYAGHAARHGGIVAIHSCNEFAQTVTRERADWVLVAATGYPFFGVGPIQELPWLLGDPAARLVAEEPSRYALFRIEGALDGARCGS